MRYQLTENVKYEAECLSPHTVVIHTEDVFLVIPILFAVAIEKEQLADLSEDERNRILLNVIDAVCKAKLDGITQKVGEA